MAISISGNGRTAYGPRITRDGLILYLDAANTKSVLGRRSLINWANWTTGSGGVSGYNQNGQTIENERVIATNPWGVNDVVWESRPSGNGNDDGGWNTDWFNIDRTKLYRFSVWVRRTSSTSGGTFYLGMFANGDGSRRTDNSAVEGNAYWECSGTGVLTQNQWYLWVGHCYPSDTTYTGRHPDTGYYTTTGGRVGNINGCNIGAAGDLKWSSNSTQGIHRTYHYYCGDNTTRLQFYQPRVDLVDGSEPSITQLLQDAGSYWYDLTSLNNTGKPVNGTSYNSSNYGSIVFDGSNDYVSVPSNSTLNLTSQGTISVWIYPNTLTQGSFTNLVSRNTGGSVNLQSYTLSWRQTSNGLYAQICNGANGYNDLLASFPTVANVWYNIVFVWNGAQLILYNNGVVVASSAQTINCQVLETTLDIGGFTYKGAGGDQETFNGRISQVQIYNRGLTLAEVLRNFNGNKKRYGIV